MFDAVVMDSALQFISPDIRASVISGVCSTLSPDGPLIVIVWPNEEDPSWVSKLITETAGSGVAVPVDAETLECDAVFDGEETHMVWSVTVAKAAAAAAQNWACVCMRRWEGRGIGGQESRARARSPESSLARAQPGGDGRLPTSVEYICCYWIDWMYAKW
jgi:hypothetical protein